MRKHGENSDNKKHQCWINDTERIISFNHIEGYELKEFDSYTEFQEYCYRKTYWGYKVK